jgi:hypothetical protein
MKFVEPISARAALSCRIPGTSMLMVNSQGGRSAAFAVYALDICDRLNQNGLRKLQTHGQTGPILYRIAAMTDTIEQPPEVIDK